MRYLLPALLAASVLNISLITAAPAPPLPPPKKLDRVPDPSPELRKELDRIDNEYRNGSEEKFAELEKRADELLKRFPEKDDQARIWSMVAHVAAQSGIADHADRVRKYADKCLAVSRDPLQRGLMYSYRASAVDLSGTAFPKGRREAAEILLTGYVELLAQELPEQAPELPVVHKFPVGDQLPKAEARAQYAAQMAARQEAEFTRDLIGRRDTLVMQFRDLYKPEPNYHGRNPEGPDELRALVKKKLTEPQVKVLLEKVTK
jgi:hypothetical protein